MAAGELDLTIEQGADWTKTITFERDGSAVNLAGATIRMQARATYASEAKILDLSIGDGIALVTTGLDGKFRITMEAEETALLTTEIVRYDIEIVESDGTTTRLLEGQITLSLEVTR